MTVVVVAVVIDPWPWSVEGLTSRVSVTSNNNPVHTCLLMIPPSHGSPVTVVVTVVTVEVVVVVDVTVTITVLVTTVTIITEVFVCVVYSHVTVVTVCVTGPPM